MSTKIDSPALNALLKEAKAVGIDTTKVEAELERLKPWDKLSPREMEVLQAIARGESPTVGAEKLGISTKTFATYRARIIDKLKVRSNAEIAVLAFELGLVAGVKERL